MKVGADPFKSDAQWTVRSCDPYEDTVGENDDDDLKTTIMDPNTRSLIRVQIGDIENDLKLMQMLRGSSPVDALNRKQMMRGYKIPKDLIDT